MRVTISLLGPFQLTIDGATVALPVKAQGVLALVAGQEYSLPRDKIAEYIWPNRGQQQSRQSLRQALLSIRKRFGDLAEDVLQQDNINGTLKLKGIKLDVIQFNQANQSRDRHELSHSMELYRGEFLADFPEISEYFDTWCLTQRSKFSLLAAGMLRQLASLQADEGEEEIAVATAHRLLALDPLREDAHRLLMEIYARFGRRAEALRQYEICADILRKELAVSPAEETASLARHLRSLLKPHSDVSPTPDRQKIPAAVIQKPTLAVSPVHPGPAATLDKGDRRQLTVMFCDLKGTVPFSSLIDPEEAIPLIEAYRRTFREAVQAVDGAIAQCVGEGIFVYFGSPISHENDAERAVHAALSAIRSLRELGEARKLNVGVGIATGLVVLSGDAQKIAFGEPINLAQKLQSCAGANNVVICETTFRLLRHLFRTRELEPLTIGGLEYPIRTFQVVSPSEIHSRFKAYQHSSLAPFVARQEETDFVLRRWRDLSLGEGHGILITGEPGIGKSRLIDHALKICETTPRTMIEYHCSSLHTQTRLLPVINEIRRSAGITEADTDADKSKKLADYLQPGPDEPYTLPAISELLGLPAEDTANFAALSSQQKKGAVLKALLAYVTSQARKAPGIVIFEDAHWSDPTSLDFLDQLVSLLPEHPFLVLVSARPEFQAGWIGEAHITTLALNRLTRRDGEELIQSVAGKSTLPKDLVQEILNRTDGVPLFIEELTRMAVEKSAGLSPSRAPSQGSITVALPSNLQASLSARLDRLPSLKGLAQIGACIGREFSHEMLVAVSEMPEDDLREGLANLLASGLVRRRGTDSDATYIFKHALVQDAAYESLLKSRRLQIHATITRVLKEKYPALQERQPELIAHHLTLAQDYVKAVEYWLRAAKKDLRASADLEAVGHLRRGLAAVGEISDEKLRRDLELKLQGALVGPLVATGGACAPEVAECYERGLALAAADGASAWLFPFLYGKFTYAISTSQIVLALEVARKFIEASRKVGYASGLVVGHRMAGFALLAMGNFQDARQSLETSLELYNPERDEEITYILGQNAKVNSLALLSLAEFFLGRTKQSRLIGLEAIEIARNLKHPHSLAISVNYWCWTLFFLDDNEALLEQAEVLVQISVGFNLDIFATIGHFFLGLALFRQGQRDAGIQRMKKAIADFEAARFKLALANYVALLAEAKCVNGQLAEARGLLAKMKDMMRGSQERWFATEMLLIEAKILLASDPEASKEARLLIASARRLAQELSSPTLVERCDKHAASIFSSVGSDPMF